MCTYVYGSLSVKGAGPKAEKGCLYIWRIVVKKERKKEKEHNSRSSSSSLWSRCFLSGNQRESCVLT